MCHCVLNNEHFYVSPNSKRKSSETLFCPCKNKVIFVTKKKNGGSVCAHCILSIHIHLYTENKGQHITYVREFQTSFHLQIIRLTKRGH